MRESGSSYFLRLATILSVKGFLGPSILTSVPFCREAKLSIVRLWMMRCFNSCIDNTFSPPISCTIRSAIHPTNDWVLLDCTPRLRKQG